MKTKPLASLATTVVLALSFGGAARADSFSMSPGRITGCLTATGTISLSAAAPAGGTTFTLSSSHAEVQPPAQVTVPEGATRASFSIATTQVASPIFARVTATSSGSTVSNSISVGTMTPKALGISPRSIGPNMASTGTVTLQCVPTVADVPVDVVSADPSLVQVDVARIIVPIGSQSASFGLTSFEPTTRTSVKVTASAGGEGRADGISVGPPAVKTISWPTSSPIGGSSMTGTVVLDYAAPSTGVVVDLASANTALLQIVSPQITIAAGAKSGTFDIQTSNVSTDTPVGLSATANGVTYNTSLTLRPNRVMRFFGDPDTVALCRSATMTVELHSPAGPGPLTVSLSNDRPDLVGTSVAEVVIPAGEKRATFTVSAKVRPAVADMAILAASLNGRVNDHFIYVPRVSRVACP